MTETKTAWRRLQSGRLLKEYLAPEKRLVVVLLVVVLAVMALEVGLPLMAGKFIDDALADAQSSVLHALAAVFVTVAVGHAVAKVVQAYLGERLALNTTNRLRADLTRHCLLLDSSFHDRYRPGELVERIEGDVGALGKFLSSLLVNVVSNILLLLAVLTTLFFVDWRLGLVLTGFVALICLVLNALRGRATPMWAAAMQADAEQSGYVAEQLAATEDVRSSGALPYAQRRFTQYVRNVLSSTVTATRRTASLERITQLLFMTALASGLAIGSWLVLYEGATVATIYLVYRYSDLVGAPIHRLNRQVSELQRAGAAAARIEELFAIRSTVVDGPGVEGPGVDKPGANKPGAGKPGVGGQGGVRGAKAPGLEVASVSFAYEPGRPVLRDVSFRVEPGCRLGIVGRTGSGKSTIARLLLRLADPASGAIRLDGHDLREMTLADVRARVGLVTQDVRISHMSLRDNLTLFDHSVPDERIVDVIHELGLGRLLKTLPDGLDTVLAAGGGLSAGEAQMVALTRVFLRDPQIVVFDEATSRLDAATEGRIDVATERLLAGRTAIVIAHRLATLERMDQILVIDDGQVVEFGDRGRLIADDASRFAGLLRLDDQRAAI